MGIGNFVLSVTLAASMLAVTIGAVHAQDLVPKGQEIGHQTDIAAFIKADQEHPQKKGQILFIGSSIFRQWAHLTDQMAPLPVFNRAFGGSRTWEVLHYADQVVLPYEPKIIVYYCGSNDVNAGEKSEAIFERYRLFSEKVREKLPDTQIYYVSILRAPQKKDHWDIVDGVNKLAQDYSSRTKNRSFIDINPAVFDTDGKPRMELYQTDGLHYHDEAYVEFTAIVKPVLETAWKQIKKIE